MSTGRNSPAPLLSPVEQSARAMQLLRQVEEHVDSALKAARQHFAPLENVVSDVPVDPRKFPTNASVAEMEQRLLMIRTLFPDLRVQVLSHIATGNTADSQRRLSTNSQSATSPLAQEGKGWNYGLMEDSPNKDTPEGRWNSLGQSSNKLQETLNEARQRIANLRGGITPSEAAANNQEQEENARAKGEQVVSDVPNRVVSDVPQKNDRVQIDALRGTQAQAPAENNSKTAIATVSLVPVVQAESVAPPRTQARIDAQPQRAAPPFPLVGGQAPVAWREPAEWTKEEVAAAEAGRSQAEHPEFARISKILPMTYLQLSLPMLPYKQIMAQVQPRVLSAGGRAGVYNVVLTDPNAPTPNPNGQTTTGPPSKQPAPPTQSQPSAPATATGSHNLSSAKSPANGANPGPKGAALAGAPGTGRQAPGGQGPLAGVKTAQPKMQLVNLLDQAKMKGKNQVVGRPPSTQSPPITRTQPPTSASQARRPASAAASPSLMVRATPPPGALYSPQTRSTGFAGSTADRRYAPAYSLTSPNPPPAGYVIRRPSPGPAQSGTSSGSAGQINTGKITNANQSSNRSSAPAGAYQVQRGGFPGYGGVVTGVWGGLGHPQRSPVVSMHGATGVFKSPALQGSTPASRGTARIPT